MANHLKGKVAVVTGSGQGIGRAIAMALAREGAMVVTNNRKPGSTGAFVYDENFVKSLSAEKKEWLLSINREKGGDAATVAREIENLGGRALPFFGDVSDFKVAGKLIETAISGFGSIDILVNNAGTFRHRALWEMTEEDWDYVTGNKPKSAFNTIRHAAPHMMKQRWGRIINCTSTAWLGTLEHCAYSAANAGVVGLSRSVARELWPYGITCNVYTPNAVTRASYNKFLRRSPPTGASETIATEEGAWQAGKPDEVKGNPDYLAPFVAYLATEEAGNISGTVFRIRAEGSLIGIYSEPAITGKIMKQEGFWTVDELIERVPPELLRGYQNPVY